MPTPPPAVLTCLWEKRMATPTTDFYALLMYFPMVITENFLARTFGSYTLQLFEINDSNPPIYTS